MRDGEFIILWTTGVKKIHLVHLFFSASILILALYLILSTVITPFTLNKSRQLLSNNDLNSLLPTLRSQQFSDSFKGLTFFVEKKIDNELRNIFLHDKGNNLANLSTNISETKETTIIAENGILEDKKLLLLNGQIISNKAKTKSEIIKFQQLSVDLSNLTTTTIKQPKIQETSTLKLLNCFFIKNSKDKFCNSDFKKEIITTMNRRIVMPFYIPILSLICAFLLINSNSLYSGKLAIFSYSFILLLFSELAVRYTGINKIVMLIFLLGPILLAFNLYFLLIYKFSKEAFYE